MFFLNRLQSITCVPPAPGREQMALIECMFDNLIIGAILQSVKDKMTVLYYILFSGQSTDYDTVKIV